jgi:hypothetical protein
LHTVIDYNNNSLSKGKSKKASPLEIYKWCILLNIIIVKFNEFANLQIATYFHFTMPGHNFLNGPN